jgi:hypothetical protein
MTGPSKSVVVALTAPEVCTVSGSGHIFSFWGAESNARFWRILMKPKPEGSAEVLRAKLCKELPEGCRLLVGSFEWSIHGAQDGGRANGSWAEVLVDVGGVRGLEAIVRGRLIARSGVMEDAIVMPLAWDAGVCWEQRGLCTARCYGEVAWECQERILGRDLSACCAGSAGSALVEREFDCIAVECNLISSSSAFSCPGKECGEGVTLGSKCTR